MSNDTPADTLPTAFGHVFEPSRPGTIVDPYPALRHFREHNPVHHVPELGGRAFFRYDDCHRIFRDPRFSRDPLRTPAYRTFVEANRTGPSTSYRLSAFHGGVMPGSSDQFGLPA